MKTLLNSQLTKGIVLFLFCTVLVLGQSKDSDHQEFGSAEQELISKLEGMLRQDSRLLHFQGVQVPGCGLVLSTRLQIDSESELRHYVEETLSQASFDVTELKKEEQLVWLLEGDDVALSVRFPLDRLTQRLSYQYAGGRVQSSSQPALTEERALKGPKPENSTDSSLSAIGASAPEGEQRLLSSPWLPLGGEWEIEDDLYLQKQLGHYDLVSYCRTKLSPPYTLKSDLMFLEGEMGGGLIFGATDAESKNGATMASFTAGGTFLQCGYFNDQGVFVFQDGRPVLDVADGAWHQLSIRVGLESYQVSLDGQIIIEDVPLNSMSSESFAGLFVSTSKVAFRGVTCRGE